MQSTGKQSKTLAGYLMDLLSDIAHLAIKVTIMPIHQGYRDELIRIAQRMYDNTRRRLVKVSPSMDERIIETDKQMTSICNMEPGVNEG